LVHPQIAPSPPVFRQDLEAIIKVSAYSETLAIDLDIFIAFIRPMDVREGSAFQRCRVTDLNADGLQLALWCLLKELCPGNSKNSYPMLVIVVV
jgi:hypothetical protein